MFNNLNLRTIAVWEMYPIKIGAIIFSGFCVTVKVAKQTICKKSLGSLVEMH